MPQSRLGQGSTAGQGMVEKHTIVAASEQEQRLLFGRVQQLLDGNSYLHEPAAKG